MRDLLDRGGIHRPGCALETVERARNRARGAWISASFDFRKKFAERLDSLGQLDTEDRVQLFEPRRKFGHDLASGSWLRCQRLGRVEDQNVRPGFDVLHRA